MSPCDDYLPFCMYVSLFDKVHLIQSLETHFMWLYSLSIYVVRYLIKLDIFMVLTLQCHCGVNSNCCSG